MNQSRVLIVDDNRLNAELAEFVLESDDFLVDSAIDAEQALARIPEFRPDLILMDIQMPGMDGLELTRRLKGDPSTRHIVIIAFTAHAMKGDELRMRQAGCDGYVSKPIAVATFASTIRSFGVTGHSSAAPDRG